VITSGDHGITINDWHAREIAVESGAIEPFMNPGKETDMINHIHPNVRRGNVE
jgi:hypothetical protein